ncbi:MAG: DUF362 domain-containing protein [Deltaproteobacteria bacterium]|nr:DUF362 domain-containing protein [Deltaproteobacteria bacterium]MBW2121148.1 DUF362 domain-containing protein [Deltaproteobacteria bacterium]
MKAGVSILRTASSPDLEAVCEDLHRGLEPLGGLEPFAPKGSMVLLKPNIGVAATPEEGRNTDPRVIEAMIILLREVGVGEIIIGESSVVGTDTLEAFRAAGVDRIARQYGIPLVDLKRHGIVTREVPDPLILPSIRLSSIIDEVDLILDLPKLKTIFAVPISIGMKNLKGLLPDAEKKRFHHTDLSKAIVDLNKVVRPRLTVVDGIISSELYEPRETNILIAGGDVLAVDAVASSVIGLDPHEIEYLRLAGRADLGALDLERIDILGESLSESRLNLKLAPDRTEGFAGLYPEVEIVDGQPCSGCVASLYLSLKRAKERGLLERLPDLKLALGSKIGGLPPGERVLCLGNCTKKLKGKYFLPGCPFMAMEFCDLLERGLRK